MNIAFDMDGVLDKPKIRDLAYKLYEQGHKIYIFTGGLNNFGEWSEESRRTQMKNLEVQDFTLIRVIASTIELVGKSKGIMCNLYHIDIFFDDSILYMEEVSKVSKVQRVLVI